MSLVYYLAYLGFLLAEVSILILSLCAELRSVTSVACVLCSMARMVSLSRRGDSSRILFVFLFTLRGAAIKPFKVPVWAVLDYTETRCITRELLLVKVSILGPEYLEDQLQGGPSHEPRRGIESHHSTSENDSDSSKLGRDEVALAQNFENSASGPSAPSESRQPISPSEALRTKHQHLHSISVLASQFGAKLVDVSENSVIVEMSGKTSRVEAFLSLVKPFGVLESARTGSYYIL